MAAGIIVFPGFMPAVDGDGNRLAGAKAYFYVDGTGTLATTVYSDAGLTALHANPVEADSLGVWPAMWADTANLYTVQLTDSDGVPLSSGTWSGLGPAIDATTASVALSSGFADEAAASAASALGAPGTSATSSTNLAIGLGARTFVLNEEDKAFSVGQRVVAASSANALNQYSGIITAFDGTNLTVQMDTSSGAGAHADWGIALTGYGAVSSVAGLVGAIVAATLKTALSLDAVQNLAVAGRQAIWIPAGAMTSRTTNGPSAGLNEMPTNRNMLRSWDFDAATREYVQFAIRMPKGWDEGNVTAVFEWSHAATATNFKVAWALQAVAISDDDTGDVAFGAAQQTNDSGGTTNDLYASPETAAVVIAGAPAAEDVVMCQAYRVADDAVNDTLTIDARLHGVTLYINTAAAIDA